jgi:putative endonuclease
VADDGEWWVYILRCADDTLYTGITTDLERRIAEHDAGEGAKYTRGRGPVELVYSERQPDRSSASQREYALKQYSRDEKLELLAQRSGE